MSSEIDVGNIAHEHVTVASAYFPLPSFAVHVIVALPLLTEVTNPVELTVATAGFFDVHVTDVFVALDGDILAVNCLVDPADVNAIVVVLSVIDSTKTVLFAFSNANIR